MACAISPLPEHPFQLRRIPYSSHQGVVTASSILPTSLHKLVCLTHNGQNECRTATGLEATQGWPSRGWLYPAEGGSCALRLLMGGGLRFISCTNSPEQIIRLLSTRLKYSCASPCGPHVRDVTRRGALPLALTVHGVCNMPRLCTLRQGASSQGTERHCHGIRHGLLFLAPPVGPSTTT